jgi:protein involved in polysaccharide export with SLBB domain
MKWNITLPRNIFAGILLALFGAGCTVDGPLLRTDSLGSMPTLNLSLHHGKSMQQQPMMMEPISDLPTEKMKVTLPPYVIEAPDVLLIDIGRAIPKPPYYVQPGDALSIQCPQAPKDDPIQNTYVVNPNGTVKLGNNYGAVFVADLTLEKAQEAIRKHLTPMLGKADVSVALVYSGELHEMKRDHLVRPDGTVGLGSFGSDYVVGFTLDEARNAIQQQLDRKLVKPSVTVDVLGFNSKFYYVIVDGIGPGEQVAKFPATGNETVLDSLAHVSGLPACASKLRVWVARPAPPHCGCNDQILPVDWCAVVKSGNTKTNYQLLPGDRVYVECCHEKEGHHW